MHLWIPQARTRSCTHLYLPRPWRRGAVRVAVFLCVDRWCGIKNRTCTCTCAPAPCTGARSDAMQGCGRQPHVRVRVSVQMFSRQIETKARARACTSVDSRDSPQPTSRASDDPMKSTNLCPLSCMHDGCSSRAPCLAVRHSGLACPAWWPLLMPVASSNSWK